MGQAKRGREIRRVAAEPDVVFRSRGIRVQVAGTGALAVAYGEAIRTKTHLWVAAGLWQVTDPEALLRAGAQLEPQALLSMQPVGCYLCETLWTPGVTAGECLGVPVGESPAPVAAES